MDDRGNLLVLSMKTSLFMDRKRKSHRKVQWRGFINTFEESLL